jgi:hypothetical protein
VTFYYAPGAEEDALPERISGVYQTTGGPGAFEIVRNRERYRDVDLGATHEQAHVLMPWVVVEGDW